MQVRYGGSEDFRILTNKDIRPPEDGEWEDFQLVWAKDQNHVLEVPDNIGEAVIQEQGFRKAADDEVAKSIEMLEEQRNWDEARKLGRTRSIASNEIFVVPEAPEDSAGSSAPDESRDDASSDTDD